MIYEY